MKWLFRIVSVVMPPPQWRTPVIMMCGLLAGIGMYAFYVSNAVSYLSDSPQTCINCHVMAPHYATWQKSSHREHATCSDCHVPQDNLINKYLTKAKDGTRHAYVFTVGGEPVSIRLNEDAAAVVQANCVRCHTNENLKVSAVTVDTRNLDHGLGKRCWDCHREVPHGAVSSVATVPFAQVPLPQSPVPEWLHGMTNRGK
jgi:cytochrome c nitrite reductase small subunit